MDKYLYKVDFMAKTITITAECAERMNNPDTTEYKANILSFSANRNSIAETPTAVFQLVNTRFISHSKALLWKFFGRLPQPCDLNESEKINR